MHCDVCGFRRELWTDGDLRTTLEAAPHLARHVLDGAARELQAELTRVLAPIADLPREGLDLLAVHDAMHLLHEAGRLRHAGTTAASTGAGSVAQVSRSGGGVPKLPVDRVAVTADGVEGDRQGNRRHHGRPWQAVCLWSAEVIEDLQREGHPIGFGSAGENLTVRGLDWAGLSPGVRLLAGTAVLQVTSYAIPCAKNRGWFSDGDFRRMSHETRPGRSRLYAAVVTDGVVAQGDAVVVEPVELPARTSGMRQLPLSL
jgi:MOSC domain-containing protein YiiM